MFGQTWIMRALLAVLFVAFALGLRLGHPHSAPLADASTPPDPVTIQPALPTPTVPIGEKPLPPPSTESVEVCGIGKLTADADKTTMQQLASSVEPLRQQWLDAMLHSGDVRSRATGLLLSTRVNGDRPQNAPSDEFTGPLVQLALSSQDPAVYAMAVYACQPLAGLAPGAACAAINVEGWAAMEPNNAAPWLAVARAAHTANDVVAENAAFSKAAKATMIDGYAWSLFPNAEALLPVGATPLDRYLLTVYVIGVEASLPLPSVPMHCSAEAVKDKVVRSQCSALAELMVSKGTTLIELGLGISMGARAGWPANRVEALRQRKEGLMGLMLSRDNPSNPKDQWTCETIERGNAFMKDWARVGEIGALQLELERSGKTLSELSNDYRDYTDDLMRKAAQAASLQSAPSK